MPFCDELLRVSKYARHTSKHHPREYTFTTCGMPLLEVLGSFNRIPLRSLDHVGFQLGSVIALLFKKLKWTIVILVGVVVAYCLAFILFDPALEGLVE
jgi:hypothetical protein